MKIHESDYLILQFEKENNRFVQFWKSSPESFERLKEEFLTYTSLYKKFKPQQTLWLQQNFSLTLTREMDDWIEMNVNVPCVKHGNKKVAFVVGKDVLTHLSLINSFEDRESVINPRHFASETEARKWLDESHNSEKSSSELSILFEGIDKQGNSVIKIKRPAGDIAHTIRSLNHLIKENNFINSNILKYSALTRREKEIMVVFSRGLKHQEAADELYISVETLRTHWRNIKRKLEIKSIADVINYVRAFNMK